jgi:hypothetical protein
MCARSHKLKKQSCNRAKLYGQQKIYGRSMDPPSFFLHTLCARNSYDSVEADYGEFTVSRKIEVKIFDCKPQQVVNFTANWYLFCVSSNIASHTYRSWQGRKL